MPRLDIQLPGDAAQFKDLPRYVIQRHKRRAQRLELGNSVVDSLNRMAASTTNTGGLLEYVAPSYRNVTAGQSEVHRNVMARLLDLGACPTDLAPERALEALMRARYRYPQEPE